MITARFSCEVLPGFEVLVGCEVLIRSRTGENSFLFVFSSLSSFQFPVNAFVVVVVIVVIVVVVVCVFFSSEMTAVMTMKRIQ